MRFRLPFLRPVPSDAESADAWEADIRWRRWTVWGAVAVVFLASVAWVTSTITVSSGPERSVTSTDGRPARIAQDMIGLDPELLVADAFVASGSEAVRINATIPVSTLPNPAMPGFAQIVAVTDQAAAEDCLTAAIYYEAGFEALDGQRAVAQVVLNRVRHPLYPKTVCGVVLQGYERQTGCQFSFTCDGAWAKPADPKRYAAARAVAKAALGGYVHRPVGAATHYHASYVLPYWAPRLVKIYVTGAHIFYRFPGFYGSPAAMRGRYAGDELIPDGRATFRSTEISSEPAAPEIEVGTLELDPLIASPIPTGIQVAGDAGGASTLRTETAAGQSDVLPKGPPEPPRRPASTFRDDKPLVSPPPSVGRTGW